MEDVDGTKNNLGAGGGVILKSPKGAIFAHCVQLNFPVTNNEAEYEAFIVGLQSASKLKLLSSKYSMIRNW